MEKSEADETLFWLEILKVVSKARENASFD